MAELGDATDNSCRDNVDGLGNGRNREISACAIRDRAPPQQCASSNPWKPVPRVGPIPVIIQSGSNLVASMKPEDLDTPPFTAQERLIYVPVEILNIRFGALLDSGCSDNFISRTTADQLGLTRYHLKTAIGMQMAKVTKPSSITLFDQYSVFDNCGQDWHSRSLILLFP